MTHVLIVDEDIIVRQTFQSLLRDEGYEVNAVADFFEAESFLAFSLMPSSNTVGSVDVVVTNIALPRVDGLELLRRVRQFDEDIPVLMMTDEPDLATAAEAVRLGAYDYVTRPIAPEALLRVVKRAAERKRLLDEKRRLEQENWAYQAELEQKVLERTAELTQRNRELSALIDIGRDMTSTLDLEQVLRRISQRTAQVCGAYRCLTILLSESSETDPLFVEQFANSADQSAPSTCPAQRQAFTERWRQELTAQTPEVQRVIETGQPLSFATREASPMMREWLETFDIVNLLLIPIISRERIVGLMALDQIEAERTFSPTQIELALGIAACAVITVENVQLFREERQYALLLSMVSQIARQIVSILDLEQILRETVQAIRRHFGYANVLLCLLDERDEDLVIRAAAGGFEPLMTSDYRQPVGVGIMGKTAETGRPYLVNDVKQNPHYITGHLEHPPTRSELCVPLIVRNKVIGVLDAQDAKLNAFGQVDRRALEMLADQIAVAIENARLYETTQRHVDELMHAYKELQETAHLRTELVQNVSHELRTPLSLIHGYTELLLQGDMGALADEQMEALEIILARSNNLARLIHDLTMLRIIPRMTLNIEAISIVEVVRRQIEDFRLYAESNGVTFEDEMPDHLPPIQGDRERLAMVFSHLIENGIKFNPGGGVVNVQAWESGDYIQIPIADDGIGISAEHIDRIFERFYQVDGSASRRFSGMGVGLALVWEIVEAHSGAVSVESDPGVGSTFTVILPLAGPEDSTPDCMAGEGIE